MSGRASSARPFCRNCAVPAAGRDRASSRHRCASHSMGCAKHIDETFAAFEPADSSAAVSSGGSC